MAPRRLTAELVVDGRWELGEGPIWDTQTGELVWVDILGQQVLRYRPGDERATSLPTPLDVGVAWRCVAAAGWSRRSPTASG